MVNKLSSVYLFQDFQLRFEIVLFQFWVGQRHSDAAFGEACGVHVDVSQQVAYRRKDGPVSFQFDDDQLVCPVVVVGLEVVEPDVEVDGQTLRLALVHEGYSVKLVPHHSVQAAQVQPRLSLHQLVCAFRVPEDVLRGHFKSLLLGPCVIVLVLDFQECQLACYIRSHSHLHSPCTLVVVHHV